MAKSLKGVLLYELYEKHVILAPSRGQAYSTLKTSCLRELGQLKKDYMEIAKYTLYNRTKVVTRGPT